MVKQSFYCVPNDKAVKKAKNGIVYHCEIDKKATAAQGNSISQSVEVKCNVCNKEFKDLRCLKIHKTKKDHWGSSVNDPDNGPKRPTKYHKDLRGNGGNDSPTSHNSHTDVPMPKAVQKRKRKQSTPKRFAKTKKA